MNRGSRRTPDSLLEAATASLAFLLGVALASSTTAPMAAVVLGWVLLVGGAAGLAVVLTRR